MNSDNFFKNIAIATVMIMCVVIALIALHMAEQANNRAESLSKKIELQRETLSMQDDAISRILSMSGAHQGLIEGILDNQEGIVDLVAKRSKAKRIVANTAP